MHSELNFIQQKGKGAFVFFFSGNKIEQKLEPVEFIVKTDKNHNYDMHFKIIIMISFSKINHHLNLH